MKLTETIADHGAALIFPNPDLIHAKIFDLHEFLGDRDKVTILVSDLIHEMSNSVI